MCVLGGARFVRADVAKIGHLMPQIRQSLIQTSHAIGVRPHSAALTPLASVHRSADQYYVFVVHMTI